MNVEDVETVAVLGAGNMGHGIAEVAALAGYDVRMRDIRAELVEEGIERIEDGLRALIDADQVSQRDAERALDRIEGVVDLEAAVEDADVVIEAVPEKMEVKKNVYREAEQYAPDWAVFATNTSSLSVTELASGTDRPERFCGLHFFNPPIRMQLVEVIPGEQTDEDVLELASDLAEAMGKTPVRVHEDSPGFIVNRVLAPAMNEAAWLVHRDEATTEAVDAAARYEIGLPKGPFEMADSVGIDVGLHVLEYMHDQLGDAYEPCPLLVGKVERGQVGEKTGRGFYDWEDGGANVSTDDAEDWIAPLLTAVMANEVAKLVSEGVAEPTAIDRAMKLGAGFPEGPARLADDAGLSELYETLLDRQEETGAARYEPAAELERRVTEGIDFHGVEDEESTGSYETLSVSVADRVGHVEIDREHRMNTITVGMLDELVAAVERFEADEGVRAILLTGAGERAFSAGADVQSAAGSAEPLDAVELSRKGQRALGRIEECDLPVIAGIDGYCLGGGMELAACADLRIASRRSELGHPEHDLGLLPAWGGTQRLRHIIGEGRAKELIFTAEQFDAETLADYGFLNEVVGADSLEERAHELAAEIAAGPPIAQRLTKRVMLAGRDDTEAGLEAEAQAFGHLMGTDDAMEGISALMSDREPEFEGE